MNSIDILFAIYCLDKYGILKATIDVYIGGGGWGLMHSSVYKAARQLVVLQEK